MNLEYVLQNLKKKKSDKTNQYMIGDVLFCVQWANPSTPKHGSGTTEWSGTDAAQWWTPGGKLVMNTQIWEINGYWKLNKTRPQSCAEGNCTIEL